MMHDFCRLNRRQRIIQRNRTERLSDLLDWKSLGIYYRQARLKALNNVYGDVEEDEAAPKISGRYNFPMPISAPITPIHSRNASPHDSDGEGDDEGNLSHDSEEEQQELISALTEKLTTSN